MQAPVEIHPTEAVGRSSHTSCVKVKPDPDVDSRRSTLNAVVFTINDSLAKFVCVVCTRKSGHCLHLVSGSHPGVSPQGYTRFVSVWEISSGNVSVFGDLKVDNGWMSLKANPHFSFPHAVTSTSSFGTTEEVDEQRLRSRLNAFVGTTRHFDNAIDWADLEGFEDMKVDNIVLELANPSSLRSWFTVSVPALLP